MFEACLASGDGDATQRALAHAVAQETGPATAYLRISQAAARVGLLEMAIQAALDAAAQPAGAKLALAIAKQLQVLGETRAAVQLGTAIETDDRDELHECARLLMQLGVHEPARARMRAAQAAGLSSAAFHKTLATLHTYFGEADAAEAHYLEAMRLGAEPVLATPMSRLRTWSSDHNHVDLLLAARATSAQGSIAFADLSFALFRQLDDLGRHEEAWPMLEAGARAMRANVRHDAAAHSRLVDNLVALPVPVARNDGDTGPVPIFILGLPRTGSTLLERLLGEHPGVMSAGERPDFTVQARRLCGLPPSTFCDQAFVDRATKLDVAELGRRYREQAGWRADGKGWFIDKQPMNFLHIALIHAALPSARIIHTCREPIAACFSIYKFLFARGHEYSYDLSELAGWHHDYRRLMRHWHEALPGVILDVPHEALIADLDGEMRRVRAFCGLDDVQQHEAVPRPVPIATGSALQAAGPVTETYAGRWRPYAMHLEPLREALPATPL